MEWIKALLAKHTKEDGTVDQEAFNNEVNTEFAKNAVPKTDFNAKVEELKTANSTLETLKKDNKDVESLQKTITDHEATIQTLQENEAAAIKKHTVETALREAKATDVEYLTYKLGDVEIGEDGKIKDFDSKIKDLQANHPTFFETTEPNGTGSQPPAGFKPVENSLKGGQTTPSYTMEQIGNMSTDEINQNWDAVQASLENGGN